MRRLPGLIQGRNLERFAPARFEINAVRWRIDDTNLGRRHLVDTSMIFEPKGSDELKFVDEWQRIARGYKRQRELAVAKGDLSRLREYVDRRFDPTDDTPRSEEHTSELQSLMRISYAVFCLKQKNKEITLPT